MSDWYEISNFMKNKEDLKSLGIGVVLNGLQATIMINDKQVTISDPKSSMDSVLAFVSLKKWRERNYEL